MKTIQQKQKKGPTTTALDSTDSGHDDHVEAEHAPCCIVNYRFKHTHTHTHAHAHAHTNKQKGCCLLFIVVSEDYLNSSVTQFNMFLTSHPVPYV